MKFKKLLALGSALLLVGGLVSLGALSANADGGVTTINWDESHNQASYWTNYGPHDGASCYKLDANSNGVSSSDHGSSSGNTVTLNTFNQSWPGDHWELLVIKAGTEETVVIHPDAGVPYSAPDGKTVSHWIVCKGTTPSVVVNDAVATVSFTGPTCGTAQVLVLDTPTNATWGTVTHGTDSNGLTTFSVTATATTNHTFPVNGTSTLTYTGTLLAATGGCTPPPSCLPDTAVSYTYNATDNSGVITVTGDANAELCRKLYVVAASWTFDGLTQFPQTLDKWNPANSGNAIQKVGTYPFAAYVSCGQGDIYSSWDVPVPTLNNGTLTGSGQPYAEHFLHQDVGPHTPYTWTVDTPSLCKVTPGVAFQGYACNSYSPLVLSGTHVTFTVEYKDAPTGTFAAVAPGTYELLADFANQTGTTRYFGDLTVTPFADPGYSLLGSGAAIPLVAALPQNCTDVIDVVPAATPVDLCGTAKDKVNTPSDTTSLDYTETWNQAHTSVTVTATAKTGFTIKPGVTTSWTFGYAPGTGFTDVACPYTDLIGDPLAVPQSCVNNVITAGHIWVDYGESPGFLNVNLRNQVDYQIVAPGYNFTATNEYNDLPPGDYVVTVTAKPGFVLNPLIQSVWPLTIGTTGNCQQVDHALLTATANMKNLGCAGGGSYTLVNTPGILWYVNGSATPTPAGTYSVAKASTVIVTADIADKVANGWENGQPPPWVFTFSDPRDCLETLAFTGAGGANLGLLLSGGFLLFGGTIIAFERRFRFDRS